MNWKAAFAGVACLGFALGSALAAEPPVSEPGSVILVWQPGPAPAPPAPPPAGDDFASAPDTAPTPESSAPTMFGDLIGPFSTQFIIVRSTVTGLQQNLIFPSPPTFGPPFVVPLGTTIDALAVRSPVVTRGAFKIAENESPRPEDRVFVNFNYFNVPILARALPGTLILDPASPFFFPTGPLTVRAGSIGNTLTNNPNSAPTSLLDIAAAGHVNVYRETLGFEKTLFDDNFSVGMRLPLIQTHQGVQAAPDVGQVNGFFAGTLGGNVAVNDVNDPIGQSEFGDLSIVLKYALLNDRQTGNVFSTGLVVTVPTGGGIPTVDGTLHPTLIQPYVGYIVNFDRLYVHGFSSVAASTDARDVSAMFNDIGVGYHLYQTAGDRLLTGVVPTAELHLNTPLDHRGSQDDPVGMADSLDMTVGATFLLGRNSSLGLAVSVPLTGPRPFDVEGVAQFNFRF